MKAVLYTRVSTDEQALKGYSLDAQMSSLEEYADSHSYEIVGRYVDDGYSGGSLERPNLQKLLHDLAELKPDVILFVKLDRWSRSVANYYELDKILQKNGVSWTATEEDYETISASGRFKVNIMLSVAENERQRTSERVKAVIEYKAKNGYYHSRKTPVGYKAVKEADGIKVYIDNRELLDYITSLFLQAYTIEQVRHMTNERFKISLSHRQIDTLIHSPLLFGKYRENDSFCEPVITRDQFEQIQNNLRRFAYSRPNKRDYIFQSLIRCPVCNGLMTGVLSRNNKYYRCSSHYTRHTCTNAQMVNEKKLETELISKLRTEMQEYVFSVRQMNQPKKDIGPIKAKMDRLNDLYIDGSISKDKHDVRLAKLQQELKEAIDFNEQNDIAENMDTYLDVDFETIYKSLTPKEKGLFWKRLINYIVDGEVMYSTSRTSVYAFMYIKSCNK